MADQQYIYKFPAYGHERGIYLVEPTTEGTYEITYGETGAGAVRVRHIRAEGSLPSLGASRTDVGRSRNKRNRIVQREPT